MFECLLQVFAKTFLIVFFFINDKVTFFFEMLMCKYLKTEPIKVGRVSVIAQHFYCLFNKAGNSVS